MTKSRNSPQKPRVRRAQTQQPVQPTPRGDIPQTQQATVSLVHAELLTLAAAHDVPPGIMQLAVVEFVLAMLFTNFQSKDARQGELARLIEYLRARTHELQETFHDHENAGRTPAH